MGSRREAKAITVMVPRGSNTDIKGLVNFQGQDEIKQRFFVGEGFVNFDIYDL